MSVNESGGILIIKVRGLHKYFDPMHSLKGINLNVMKGKIVAVMDDSVWVEIAPSNVLFNNLKQKRTRQFWQKSCDVPWRLDLFRQL